ncbi:MAG: TatD family deoxyribonuclease [Firmicutes bacterium]|nr:TatD family deoxyribonuclease [Bacillota bacterium]
MFTDSHCHLYKEYYDDIQGVLNLSKESKVNRYINNGCDKSTNEEVVSLVKKYHNMYGTLGIHPEYVDQYTLEDIKFISDNIDNPKIIAIGEIGLDYHYTKVNREKQIDLFELQLKMAEENNIPVIIHSREATLDTINILKKYNVTGIIHSFSGSLETAKEYIKMGYLIGVNGVITFKNSNVKNVIKEIPLEYIVLETDSPYLTPEPNRGRQNNPSHILDIAKFVGDLKNINLDELSKITNNNIKKLFNI